VEGESVSLIEKVDKNHRLSKVHLDQNLPNPPPADDSARIRGFCALGEIREHYTGIQEFGW